MTLSNSRIPVPTNKRKRSPDEGTEGPYKTLKSSVDGLGKQALRIVTDIAPAQAESPTLDELLSSTDSENSLFDESPPQLDTPDISGLHTYLASQLVGQLTPVVPAKRIAPPIPGLYFDPTLLLPDDVTEDLMMTCIRTFFREGTGNQVMLFERVPATHSDSTSPAPPSPTKLPSFLSDLLSTLDTLLRPRVPPGVHDLLFSPSPASCDGPPRARQAIINLYWPGEGITSHVDLLDRYGDGIMGVSLGSGCAMQFAKVPSDQPQSPSVPDECALYLPKGSVVVMTGDARYGWTHGIEKGFDDWVEVSPDSSESVLLERDMRLSITFRWLLPGADVVGSELGEGRS
ncbi:hypothetical protein GSI_01333 [Ganoderma sinense ZZ0214-1]|uniref:Fe2OG dioxygenase domain-containing protein n=1 Tax=Ganoderma sinense ZZ0214-1 TaxID=1077348 RepID=A0A2G8SV44_9APHY|nr:hypothetical protein GSI_01333 [Ganoderma sinense ZZ0214-1]